MTGERWAGASGGATIRFCLTALGVALSYRDRMCIGGGHRTGRQRNKHDDERGDFHFYYGNLMGTSSQCDLDRGTGLRGERDSKLIDM